VRQPGGDAHVGWQARMSVIIMTDYLREKKHEALFHR